MLEQYKESFTKVTEMEKYWNGYNTFYPGGMQGDELTYIYNFFNGLNDIEIGLAANVTQLIHSIDELYTVHLKIKEKYDHRLNEEMVKKSDDVINIINILKQLGIGNSEEEKKFFSERIDVLGQIKKGVSIYIERVFCYFLEDLRKAPNDGLLVYEQLIKKHFGSLQQMVNYRDEDGNNIFTYGLIYKHGINAEKLENIISFFDGKPYTITKETIKQHPIHYFAVQKSPNGDRRSIITKHKHKHADVEETHYVNLKDLCFEKNKSGLSAFDLMVSPLTYGYALDMARKVSDTSTFLSSCCVFCNNYSDEKLAKLRSILNDLPISEVDRIVFLARECLDKSKNDIQELYLSLNKFPVKENQKQTIDILKGVYSKQINYILSNTSLSNEEEFGAKSTAIR